MAHSGSRSGQRTAVSPPRDPSSRSKRSGYVMLAVSGVVLATAFGGLATLASPSSHSADLHAGNTNTASGPQVIAGNPVPGQQTVSVNGVAVPRATQPTAVVTVGPDGKPVVTIVPAAGSPAAPYVLPPGTPIPGDVYVPPGTQLPPGTTTTPTSSRVDPPTSTGGGTTTDPTDPTHPTSPTKSTDPTPPTDPTSTTKSTSATSSPSSDPATSSSGGTTSGTGTGTGTTTP